MRMLIFLGALATGLFASEARAADAPFQLSLAFERVAGVSYAYAHPTDAGGAVKVTAYGIGGVIPNPLALPRLGIDVALPMGLTLGTGLGVGGATLTASPDQGPGGSVSGVAYVVSPRVGYRARLLPFFDLWPRVGVSFVGGNGSVGDSQSCSTASFGGPGGPTTSQTTCTTSPGGSASLFAVAASADLVAVLRLTSSFNLLAGGAFDYTLTATGSSTPGGNNATSSAADVKGRYFGVQAWLGLGGYLF